MLRINKISHNNISALMETNQYPNHSSLLVVQAASCVVIQKGRLSLRTPFLPQQVTTSEVSMDVQYKVKNRQVCMALLSEA